MSTEENKFLLHPDEGKVIQVVQERMTFKAMSADTNGAYTLFVNSAEPGGGSPPHIHHREDEAFFILEGNYEFLLGDKTLELGPGSFLIARRGIPHASKNVGTTTSRMLVIVWPAGLERCFAEMGQPVECCDLQYDWTPIRKFASQRVMFRAGVKGLENSYLAHIRGPHMTMVYSQ